MYLTYVEYQGMGGTLDEATFNDFEFEAESMVDWYTFGRLKKFEEYPESLTKCMYHLIKLIANKAVLDGTADANAQENSGVAKVKLSESNDGVSVSYNALSAQSLLETIDKEVDATIKRYLSFVVDSLGRKVLYRGIYPDE